MLVNNGLKKQFPKDKYDENGSLNNNWNRRRLQLFNAQETRVIAIVVRKDHRITGCDISKDKKLNIYEATCSTRTIERLLTSRV